MKPPSDCSPITICGKVNIPVRSWSAVRPSGSRARLISSYATPRLASSAFALVQKGHASVVYIVTCAIASESIAGRSGIGLLTGTGGACRRR